MSTFLHSLDALEHLSSEPGLLGQWARDRLFIRAPERANASGRVSALSPLIGAPGLIMALAHAEPTERAGALRVAPALGAVDPDNGDLIASLTDALRAQHAPTVAYAAHALAWCGRLDRSELPRVVRSSPNHALTGATVLLTDPTDAVAEAVVAELEQHEIPEFIGHLGAPPLVEDVEVSGVSPDDLLALGAGLGAQDGLVSVQERCSRVHAKGSRAHRQRKRVAALLKDSPGALPAALRAVYAAGREQPLSSWGPLLVGWASAWRPTTPMYDVIAHEAYPQADVLGRARAALAEADTPQVAAAAADAVPGALLLALGLADADVDAALLAGWLLGDGHIGRGAVFLHLPLLAAARTPEQIPTLLFDPESRILGYRLAAMVTTEEVVADLLALPVPVEPNDRAAYTRALAESGDRAVLPTLQPLLHEPQHAKLRELAAALYP